VRIAVLSDIHGNLTALVAVLRDLRDQAPDGVLHGGDIIGSGGRPGEIIDLIQSEGWPSVRGNTDEMLWDQSELSRLESRLPQLARTWQIVRGDIALAQSTLSASQLEWLRSLPLTTSFNDLTLVHASPESCWMSPPATATDEELLAAYGSTPRMHIYGHLHTPFVRAIGHKIIANSGSVGMPSDGDPRASYLLIDGATVTIRRVAYDIESELDTRKGHPELAWIASSLRTGKYLSP
jgi:predicted phosphodiesterase